MGMATTAFWVGDRRRIPAVGELRRALVRDDYTFTQSQKGLLPETSLVGRWKLITHPDAASPELWGRDIAADCVAMICRKCIGDWVDQSCMTIANNIGKTYRTPYSAPLPDRSFHFLSRDCQEWEWIPHRLDASRAFALPRQLSALVRPHPRVLSDDVWAKLLWAGLNLVR